MSKYQAKSNERHSHLDAMHSTMKCEEARTGKTSPALKLLRDELSENYTGINYDQYTPGINSASCAFTKGGHA